MVLKKNWVLILIALFLFSGLLVRYLDRVPKRYYCDFRVYYKAGGDFINGKNIYFREDQEITPYKYSPFFAFVFSPLSLLPIKASAAVFFAINFALTIVFFRLAYYLVQTSGIVSVFSGREQVLIYGLTLLCSFRYILLVWDSGQVNILMCVLVLAALSYLSNNKAVGTGAFFAASVLIKYTPAIFIPYLLFKRKYKAVLWTIIFTGAFLLVPALVVGLEKEYSYLSSWIPSIISTSLDKFSYIDFKNQSIYSMLLRFFLPQPYDDNLSSPLFNNILHGSYLTAVLIYLAIFIPGKSKPRGMIIDFAILMICISLFNPNAWMLNFVSLILSYMLLIQHTVAGKGKEKFILGAIILAFILTNIMSKDMFGKSSQDFGCMYSFTTLGSLVIYAALMKLKFSPCLPVPTSDLKNIN